MIGSIGSVTLVCLLLEGFDAHVAKKSSYMKYHLYTSVVFTCVLFFQLIGNLPLKGNLGYVIDSSAVTDFTIQRLSNAKVLIVWHTQDENETIIYEVLRKHGRNTQYISLGVVLPKLKEENFVEYSFIDNNDYTDSSFYCLKKTADDVVFYSLAKGVEGVEKER